MSRIMVSLILMLSIPSLALAYGDGQLLHPPKSSSHTEVSQLAYLYSLDEIDGKGYACLAYKEEDKDSGDWKIKIMLKGMRTTVINPGASSLKKNISEAAIDGKEYLVWGYNITPTNNDARLFQNRIYFTEEVKPDFLQIHLVTRNSDGTPKDEQVATINWPQKEKKTFLSAPESTASTLIKEMAYLHSYDVIANKDYAFLAYTETDRHSGEWVLRVESNYTASSFLKPKSRSFRKKIREAAAKGKNYVKFGFNIEPSDNDQRLIENRVYFDQSFNPTVVELHLVTRNADGSPMKKQLASFDWPA